MMPFPHIYGGSAKCNEAAPQKDILKKSRGFKRGASEFNFFLSHLRSCISSFPGLPFALAHPEENLLHILSIHTKDSALHKANLYSQNAIAS